MNKLLVIRFSSFGDIVQALGVLPGLKEKFPNMQVDWLTKQQYRELVQVDSQVSKVLSFGKSSVNEFAKKIAENDYDLIYDAHLSLRSILLFFISKFIYRSKSRWVFRPKSRMKRVLLFSFRVNLFPKPFIGRYSYISPLKELGLKNVWAKSDWDFNRVNINKKIIPNEPYVVFAPSAAWEMKRWPISHWRKLISKYDDKRIILIGGPADHFIEDLYSLDSDRVINYSGKINLLESSFLIKHADYVVSADTGAIHVADILGVNGVLLLGPTAFGGTSGDHIKILEKDLSCRPCSKDGRGKCGQSIYQKCLVDISVEEVLTCLRS